jgi:hypothetical protein
MSSSPAHCKVKVTRSLLLVALATGLAACDKLPIPDPNRAAEQKELDSKAIGGACRHAGRALEDCYNLNPKASKAAIFAGWREMNDYMTQNKIEIVAPTIPPKGSKTAVPQAEGEAEQSAKTPAKQSDEHIKPHAGKNPAMTIG